RAAATDMFQGVMKSYAGVMYDEIEILVSFITDNTNANVEEANSTAQSALIATISIAGIAIIISLIGMYLAIPRVATRISRITDAMRNLAGGDVDSEVPYAGRRDEIGAMAGAVQVFRDNAIERIRLEQETEANRSMSEKERIAREEQKAQEAADVKRSEERRGGKGRRNTECIQRMKEVR